MDKSIRDKLEEPFDKKHIMKRRSPKGGPELSYLEGAQYIQRFNDCTDGEWSYVIVDRIVSQRPEQRGGKPSFDLVVLVEVRAFGQVRQAFGGSVTPSAECQGDDWKAALTDALKKAIASFGVALDLYTKGELAREGEEDGEQLASPGRGNGASKSQAPPAEQEQGVTKDQLRELGAAAKAAGLETSAVSARCLEIYSLEPRELSFEQARQLIARVRSAAETRSGRRG